MYCRTAIEEEIEVLYDLYYEGLKNYSNETVSLNPVCSNVQHTIDENGSSNTKHGVNDYFKFGNSFSLKGILQIWMT
jgi:hypothetical protein